MHIVFGSATDSIRRYNFQLSARFYSSLFPTDLIMNNSLWLSTLKQSLYRHLTKRSRSRRNLHSRQNAEAVPALVSRTSGETLEDRTLLTTFTVTSTEINGAGSLYAAIQSANGSEGADTITFEASLIDQTLMIYNELVITDDVTIIGLGAEHLTLSGDGTRRLFRIDDGDAENSISVELSGFTLTNGFANYTSGGAIHSLETLSVSDVTFVDNQAGVLNDGPVYGGSFGGAIYSAGDLTVTNSTFVRNSADWYGGAIYSTGGLLSIAGCDFTENQTSHEGGAILIQDGELQVSSSSFTENSSDTLGGGIGVRNGVLSVDDTVFTENSSGSGGAIYHYNSLSFTPVFTELSITDSTFQGNTTTSNGGAVSFRSDVSLYHQMVRLLQQYRLQ
jgi:predicted outer membrane repeat protein